MVVSEYDEVWEKTLYSDGKTVDKPWSFAVYDGELF